MMSSFFRPPTLARVLVLVLVLVAASAQRGVAHTEYPEPRRSLDARARDMYWSAERSRSLRATSLSATPSPTRVRDRLTSIDNYQGVLVAGTVSQISEDLKHLRFHRCFDEGEAYAGAILITREHFLSIRPEDEPNLNDTHISIETASFQFMETRKASKLNPALEIGAIVQTLDVFDLSVVHLSAYERSLRHHGYQDRRGPAVERMAQVSEDLEMRYKPADGGRGSGTGSSRESTAQGTKRDDAEDNTNSMYLTRTLVLMPWAGSEKGVGNSKTALRSTYLKASFWSFYSRYGGNIVIGVPNEHDARIVKETLKLPALDVWVLPHLKLLPLALLAEARQKLRQKLRRDAVFASFQYVFFSESDQLLVMRQGNSAKSEIYALLDAYPRQVLVPHRLIPFAHEILKSKMNINVDTAPKFSNYQSEAAVGDSDAGKDWATVLTKAGSQRVANRPKEDYQCCLERQNCERRGREYYFGLGHAKLKFVEIDGLMVAMGNSNFRAGTFRPCALGIWGGFANVCP